MFAKGRLHYYAAGKNRLLFLRRAEKRPLGPPVGSISIGGVTQNFRNKREKGDD